ncbi:MAG: D-aminoacyl-tRNA deacylase [Thermaerobacter sp.]|nr:D-aminoacyl-tRNA deacylase [Thermaerobacter sp.]
MRVRRAEVSVQGEAVAQIGPGQACLIGFGRGDSAADLQWMARRLHALRIFEDERGRLSYSADERSLGHLLVPQFTLYGDVQRGNRPDFGPAMPPEEARARWLEFLAQFGPAQAGVFGADMLVSLENDGPVTIIIDSRRGEGV